MRITHGHIRATLANDRQLIFEAWDACVDGYQLRPGKPGPDAEHGRGLAIVDVLSKRWGVGQISEHCKAVWRELAIEQEI